MEYENNDKETLKENMAIKSNEIDEKEKVRKISENVESTNSDMINISGKLVLGVVIGVVVLIAAFTFFRGGDNTITGNVVQTAEVVQFLDSDPAATVNGEVITVGDLNNAFDSLPQQYRGSVTKDALLTQLIQTEVFYQEAVKQGNVVSKEEAEKEFAQAKQLSGLSDDEISKNLASQGTSMEQLLDRYIKQLTIQKFISDNLLDRIEVSDDEIQEYYDGNTQLFQVDEQVVVKHILIGDEDLPPKEQDVKAEEVLSQLNENNFCDFVNDYSTDTASLPTCGEYTFTMADPFVEEFKKLSFDQEVGNMGIVRTEFGPHIIWTVEKNPPQTIELDEVEESISDTLKAQKGQEQYQEFYDSLAVNNEIEVIYSE